MWAVRVGFFLQWRWDSSATVISRVTVSLKHQMSLKDSFLKDIGGRNVKLTIHVNLGSAI